MEKSQPSPLPWRASGTFIYCGPEQDANNALPANERLMTLPLLHVNERKEWPANAEFIVRAVNSHDALVAAAKSALTWCEQGGPCDWARIVVFRDALAAAITKAEGTNSHAS